MARKLTPAELREKAQRMLQNVQRVTKPIMSEDGGAANGALDSTPHITHPLGSEPVRQPEDKPL